jgi:hypothetical protein
LVRSAGSQTFDIPDYWGLAEGLVDLAKVYLLEQLDLAAIYWQATALLEEAPLFRDKKRDRQGEERLWKMTKMLAYRFVVRADGWQLLCSELHFDADVLLRELPGNETVCRMEKLARLLAFTPEQALAFLREAVAPDQSVVGEAPAAPGAYRLHTAAEVARAMREFLAGKLRSWS